MEKHWERKGVEKVFKNGIFTIFHKKFLLSPREIEGEFATIETSNWVNVIPVTDNGDFILIRQFRHGIEGTTIEIPGGSIDSTDATPADAASRELVEETGYVAGELELLGRVAPNPAILNNYCYTYLARNVEFSGPHRQDQMEFLEVFQATSTEVKEMLKRGVISHALVLAAFGHFILKGYTL